MCIYRDIEYEYKTYKKYTEYNVHIQNGSLGEVWFDAVFNSQKMVLGFVNTNIQNTDIGGGGMISKWSNNGWYTILYIDRYIHR